METEIKKTSFTLYRVVSILGIAFSAVFVVTFAIMVGYLSSNAGRMMPPDIVILQLYQSNGYAAILAIVLLVGLLVKKGSRADFAKAIMWAIMILYVVHGAVFFEYVASASQIPAESMMDMAGMYLPALCAAASFIALLSGWEKQSKAKAKYVSGVAAIVALVFSIYFLYRMFSMGALTFDQTIQLMFPASSSFVAAMLAFTVFCLCQSIAHFDAIVYGAKAEADGEAKAPEEVNAFIEDMIAEDKTEAEEVKTDAEESSADSLEQAAQDIADDIKEINDKILDGEKE